MAVDSLKRLDKMSQNV